MTSFDTIKRFLSMTWFVTKNRISFDSIRNFDVSFARWVLPYLIYKRKYGFYTFDGILYPYEESTAEDWYDMDIGAQEDVYNELLDEMIEGFSLLISLRSVSTRQSEIVVGRVYTKAKRAMYLFSRYYGDI